MAIMKMDLFSRSLWRSVTIEVVAPLESLSSGERMACLYLLHGVQGSYINWLASTNLYRYLSVYNQQHEKKLAVVMPSGANSFYQQQDAPGRSERYEQYIAKELPQLLQAALPISPLRGDTFVAGLSMGGYGALRLGLLYPQVFGFAGALSGAFITQDIAEHNRTQGQFFENPAFLRATFGDLAGIESDARDVRTLGLQAKERPRLYMACGQQDRLLPLSRGLHEAWRAAGVAHEYEEHEGGHDWTFWDWGLRQILKRV